MAFCRFCGKEIKGDHCDCPRGMAEWAAGQEQENETGWTGPTYTEADFRKDPFFIAWGNFDFSSFRAFTHSYKTATGISNSESRGRNTYERDVPIVPDCVREEENEYVVKQYNLAIMRSPLSFMKSEGRLMVTNRRLLFRAAGTGLTGRLLQEHQFTLDEIGGIEIHRDNIFSFLKLFLSILAIMLVSGFPLGIVSGLRSQTPGILLFILGVMGILPSLFVYKHFFLKLLFSAFSLSCFMTSRALSEIGSFYGRTGFDIGGLISSIMAFICFLLVIFNLIVVCIVPNLVFKVKTKGAGEALTIASRQSLRKTMQGSYSAFSEVRPWEDTDLAINELGTMIEDLQKHGDYALDKWTK